MPASASVSVDLCSDLAAMMKMKKTDVAAIAAPRRGCSYKTLAAFR